MIRGCTFTVVAVLAIAVAATTTTVRLAGRWLRQDIKNAGRDRLRRNPGQAREDSGRVCAPGPRAAPAFRVWLLIQENKGSGSSLGPIPGSGKSVNAGGGVLCAARARRPRERALREPSASGVRA